MIRYRLPEAQRVFIRRLHIISHNQNICNDTYQYLVRGSAGQYAHGYCNLTLRRQQVASDATTHLTSFCLSLKYRRLALPHPVQVARIPESPRPKGH